MSVPSSEPSEVADDFVVLFQGQEYRASPQLINPSLFAPHRRIRNTKEKRNGMEVDEYLYSKKGKLTSKQVKRLEERFEEDDILNTKTKLELVMELSLRPSQVIICYCNQRARCRARKVEEGSASRPDRYDALIRTNYHETLTFRAGTVNEKLKMQESIFQSLNFQRTDQSYSFSVLIRMTMSDIVGHNIEANMSKEEDVSAKGEVVDPQSTTHIMEDGFDGYSFPELARMLDTAIMLHY